MTDTAVVDAPVAETPAAEVPAVETPAATTETPAPSALEAAVTQEAWDVSKVPEKYIVKGEDGEIDITATFAKVDEHRANLEKRMGSGDIRPKTPEEYKVPEGFDLPIDPEKQAGFFKAAHDAGMTQKQMDFALTQFKAEVAELGIGGAPSFEEQAAVGLETIKGIWGDKLADNSAVALRAARNLAASTGLDEGEVLREIGNSPVAMQILHKLGLEMTEDTPPSQTPGNTSSIDTLMAHPGYMDAKHPEHAAISKKVKDYFDSGGK